MSTKEPTRILFVCHGNICRSTMAQSVMQQLVDQAGLSRDFVIDSAGTTNEEMGLPMYPQARDKLKEKGVPIVPHKARRVTPDEYQNWDHIVIMDDENLRHLQRIFGTNNVSNVRKLLDYAGEDGSVADPWYTRDFETTYQDVVRGCKALLNQLT